jgi:hypothetical protein
MRRRSILLGVALLWSAAGGPGAAADEKLALVIPRLFGPAGLFVDSEARLPSGQTHSAHFNSAFQSQFTQFNIALASELTALPIPTPASGFTFEFDPALGVFSRSGRSFGPVLADRAETIGKAKLTVGFGYQHFSFDEIEGVDLAAVPAVFTHDSPALGGRDDVVTTENALNVRVSQFTAFLNYGLVDGLDVAVAIPVVDTQIDVTSLAVVQRVGTSSNPAVHFYDDGRGGYGDRRTFTSSGSAAGLGDIVLRVKGRPARGLGLGLDARVPSGDEEDLLGSGGWGLKPFLVLSAAGRSVAPHLNVAYQWNGDSLLAGDVAAGTKADLPDQVIWAAGADFALSDHVTLAADLLGRYAIDSPRLESRTFRALDGRSTFADIGFVRDSFHELRGAVGLKINAKGRLLLDLNVLFSLNKAGLRDKVTPLFGFEYSF